MLPVMPEKIGTPTADNLRAYNNEIVYGGPGDDHITLSGWSHAYLVGGSGNDTYTLGNSSFAVILDSSGHDTVNLPFSVSTAAGFTIDGGRHLAIVDIYSGTAVAVVDQHKFPVETFNFQGHHVAGTSVESTVSDNGLHIGDISLDLVGSVTGLNAAFWSRGLEAEINAILAREDAIFASHEGHIPAPPQPAPELNPGAPLAPIPEAPVLPAPVPAPPAAAETPTVHATYFDAHWYLNQNADVAAAGAEPFYHFTTYGWKEGRDPNPYFDSDWYLEQNPDVAAAGVNPAEHYWNHGWHEGRDPSAEFSTSTYLALHPDVELAGVNPLEHYIHWGIIEGRDIGV